jgi:hypothetical protein
MMSLTDASSAWIYAYKSGSPILSDDVMAPIKFHDKYGDLKVDLNKAKGGSSSNPFLTTSGMAATPVTTSGGTSSGSDEKNGPSQVVLKRYKLAHGVLMGVPAVILFPLGAISMRLFSFPGLVYLHAGIQMLGLCLVIAGFGIGVWFAKEIMSTSGTNLWNVDNVHLRLGTAVFGLWIIQPLGGLLHHLLYRKQGKRTAAGHLHIWLGRAVLILAVINGGLGIQLASGGKNAEIAYGTVSGAIFLFYIAVFAMAFGRSGGKSMDVNLGEKSRAGSTHGSEDSMVQETAR